MRNEAETRADLIDPTIRSAGWGEVDGSRVGREYQVMPGRIRGAGVRERAGIADYVLVYRDHTLAVVEAKAEDKPVTEGLAQAKRYAAMLCARFAYSTNGDGIYRADLSTGDEGPVDRYATPDELWDTCFLPIPADTSAAAADAWRKRFGSIPFENRGGFWQPRYYQYNAVNRTLERIAHGNTRVLLTLATGTGKTAIAFQIVWKLYHCRWTVAEWQGSLASVGGSATGTNPRHPRVLFLADRNILADQAFNAFTAFPEDALVRIDPGEVRRNGRVPKNGSVFFTIFQTFMTGTDEVGNPQPSFGEYPPDFFDLIIIDECHRGGANDESTWRGILEYFAPAVQIGLTATPKRSGNVDTYKYFGEPVYTYSLKEGINDGFLTPFKVRQISTTLDDYIYTDDDEVLEGEVESGRRYVEEDFNRLIEIRERERARVRILMEEIDQSQKTLVFCATQEHALAVRDAINQIKRSGDHEYCVRVTANDGSEGDRLLKAFQDNEKTIPTILTTSRKLSTGVDARNVRNIVLLRPVKSMIEFKQIVGRGTRLYDDKDFFTIYDFVRAYEHFLDPEWDGVPLEKTRKKRRDDEATGGDEAHEEPENEPGPDPPPPTPRPERLRIKLADGKERQIQHMVQTSFWDPSGRPLSSKEFIERLYGDIPDLFRDEEQLREIWSSPDTRRRLLEGLADKGYTRTHLDELARIIGAGDSDVYDVLSYIAYATATMTRDQRVYQHQQDIFRHYDDTQREFIEFVLEQYVQGGIDELSQERLPQLLQLKYGGTYDAVDVFGDLRTVREVFVGFQRYLYTTALTG
jgi:type I restriction enzyme, R subunit